MSGKTTKNKAHRSKGMKSNQGPAHTPHVAAKTRRNDMSCQMTLLQKYEQLQHRFQQLTFDHDSSEKELVRSEKHLDILILRALAVTDNILFDHDHQVIRNRRMNPNGSTLSLAIELRDVTDNALRRNSK